MIKVGNTIFFELSVSTDKDHVRYRSKILDYASDKIYVSFPVNEKTHKQATFMEGTQVRAWFLGEDEAIYLFNSQLLSKEKHKDIPMLVFQDPGKEQYIRVQRREFVRIETAVDVAVYPLDGEFSPFTTVTADVSAGGMALVLPDKHGLKEGKNVQVWLALNYQSGEILYLSTKANFIRVFTDKGITKGSFKFVDFKEGEQQKITRFCFEKQLAMRNKERNIK